MNASPEVAGRGGSTDDRKRTAVQFLELVTAGRINQAYREHVDMRGRHHNPFVPAGFSALQQAMLDNHVRMPDKRFKVEHVLGEGDLVTVHARIVLTPGGQTMAAMYLFRFDGDRIVEMWDLGQPVPDDSPNEDGMF